MSSFLKPANLLSNCFAGGVDAYLAFPNAYHEDLVVRWWVCFLYAAFVIALLAVGKDGWVAGILTFIVALMLVLFLIIVIQMATQGQLNAPE